MTKAGARIEVLLNATARRNPGGKIIGVVGIGQDITGRIAQEREYSKLIDTANAPIFGVDIDGKVNVWNQCAMRLVGYTTEEVSFNIALWGRRTSVEPAELEKYLTISPPLSIRLRLWDTVSYKNLLLMISRARECNFPPVLECNNQYLFCVVFG